MGENEKEKKSKKRGIDFQKRLLCSNKNKEKIQKKIMRKEVTKLISGNKYENTVNSRKKKRKKNNQ